MEKAGNGGKCCCNDIHKEKILSLPACSHLYKKSSKGRILGVLNFGCLSDMLHYLLAYDTTLNLQVSTSMLITLECEFLLPLLGVIFRTGVEKKRGELFT